MLRVSPRSMLPVLVLLSLVACTQTERGPTPPTLAEVSEGTPALSSFVLLADALGVDLDAVTASGQFTVFAPSNTLMDAYAVAWGAADAAAFRAVVDTLTAEQFGALARAFRAHLVSEFPVLMTEEILTEVIAGADWFWYTNPRDGVDEERFTAVENRFDAATGDDDLRLRFYGRAAPYTVDISLGGVRLVASDVAFDHGILHVVDATVTASFIFPF
jgi:hypothetical protein